MAAVLKGSHFLAVSSISLLIGLQPNVLIIAALCAALGAVILSNFTMSLGLLTYPINFCALFAGAVAANLTMKRVDLPLEYLFERPLIISLGGMAVASLVTLVFLPRDKFTD